MNEETPAAVPVTADLAQRLAALYGGQYSFVTDNLLLDRETGAHLSLNNPLHVRALFAEVLLDLATQDSTILFAGETMWIGSQQVAETDCGYKALLRQLVGAREALKAGLPPVVAAVERPAL